MAVDYSAFLRQSDLGQVSLDLAIEGISSADAMLEVERALLGIPGLAKARLNLTTRRLSTVWSGETIDPCACDCNA